MSAKVTIELGAAATVIADSVRAVLRAHGLEIIQYTGIAGSRALDDERVVELCREIGNNTAQCLVAIDEQEEESDCSACLVRRAKGFSGPCRSCASTSAHSTAQPRHERARGRR